MAIETGYTYGNRVRLTYWISHIADSVVNDTIRLINLGIRNTTQTLLSRQYRLCVYSMVLLATISCIASCSDSGTNVKCGPLVVHCGEDQEAAVGNEFILYGNAYLQPAEEKVCLDEMTSVTYQWDQVVGLPIDLSDSTELRPYFTPYVQGTYRFRLRASYPVTGRNKVPQLSNECDTKITVLPACGPPTADAGADQIVSTIPGIPITVTLDGSGSHPVVQEHCNLTLIGHSWEVISEPSSSNVVIDNPNQACGR